MTIHFKLLGTGAGPGVPAFYCHCAACREARANPELARTRSGAFIESGKGNILVDASPDVRSQLIKEQIKTVDYLFLTHWHYDHFGGLGELEFYVKLSRREPVKLFLPPQALDDFHKAYPFLHGVFELVPWQFAETYSFGKVLLTPLPANHGIETAGILFEAERRIAYFPDTSGLPEATAQRLEGIDTLVCDATFYGENWYPESHMNIEEAIELSLRIKAKKLILTHLAMHYSTPVTVAELREKYCRGASVGLAYDGMVIEF